MRLSLRIATAPVSPLVGVESVVVVAMPDAVLVASKDHTEQIRRVVDHLKNNGYDLAMQHTRVHRPWGQPCDRYQVKCIMVKPVLRPEVMPRAAQV